MQRPELCVTRPPMFHFWFCWSATHVYVCTRSPERGRPTPDTYCAVLGPCTSTQREPPLNASEPSDSMSKLWFEELPQSHMNSESPTVELHVRQLCVPT